MDFQTAVRTCIKVKYAKFAGRASRSEYWFFILAIWIFTFLCLLVPLFLPYGSSATDFLLIVIFCCWLALLLPSLAVTVRRLHDLNKSGWWVLLYLLVGFHLLIGKIIAVGFCALFSLRGTIGPNRYGDDPLEANSMKMQN